MLGQGQREAGGDQQEKQCRAVMRQEGAPRRWGRSVRRAVGGAGEMRSEGQAAPNLWRAFFIGRRVWVLFRGSCYTVQRETAESLKRSLTPNSHLGHPFLKDAQGRPSLTNKASDSPQRGEGAVNWPFTDTSTSFWLRLPEMHYSVGYFLFFVLNPDFLWCLLQILTYKRCNKISHNS